MRICEMLLTCTRHVVRLSTRHVLEQQVDNIADHRVSRKFNRMKASFKTKILRTDDKSEGEEQSIEND